MSAEENVQPGKVNEVVNMFETSNLFPESNECKFTLYLAFSRTFTRVKRPILPFTSIVIAVSI